MHLLKFYAKQDDTLYTLLKTSKEELVWKIQDNTFPAKKQVVPEIKTFVLHNSRYIDGDLEFDPVTDWESNIYGEHCYKLLSLKRMNGELYWVYIPEYEVYGAINHDPRFEKAKVVAFPIKRPMLHWGVVPFSYYYGDASLTYIYKYEEGDLAGGET